ncbi:MAG: MATE family efflux transporter [Ignavibacteria bacterium]|nr:MATE family efflux transporter [Ignavibacteria bacterium]
MSDRKIILSLAIPAILQTVLRAFFIVIDAFWVGQIGSDELAALTFSMFVVWASLELGEMLATGTNSLIAQAVGAGDFSLAKKIGTQNILNSFFYSLTLGIIIIQILPLLYSLTNLNYSLSILSTEYLVLYLSGFPVIILLSVVNSIFRGNGNTRIPFYLLSIALSLNFILAPVFIFGFHIIIPMGIRGAALSTIISYFISFIIGYIVLLKKNYINSILKYKFNFAIIKESAKIGFPISLNGFAFSLIYILISNIISHYGTLGFAAVGISHRSESVSYQITVGFSIAASIITGQQIGAENPDRAEKLAWKTLFYGCIVSAIYSVALFILSKQIAGFFTSDLEIVEVSSFFNKLTAIVIIFSTIEVILEGAFTGAGYSIPPAVVGLTINFLRVPLAALFSFYWGLNGIWYAICLTVLLKGIIIFFWFKKGTWKTKRSKLLKKELKYSTIVDKLHPFD